MALCNCILFQINYIAERNCECCACGIRGKAETAKWLSIKKGSFSDRFVRLDKLVSLATYDKQEIWSILLYKQVQDNLNYNYIRLIFVACADFEG